MIQISNSAATANKNAEEYPTLACYREIGIAAVAAAFAKMAAATSYRMTMSSPAGEMTQDYFAPNRRHMTGVQMEMIMIGDDRISRMWRERLSSPSLRYPANPQVRIELITIDMASSDAFTLRRFMPD